MGRLQEAMLLLVATLRPNLARLPAAGCNAALLGNRGSRRIWAVVAIYSSTAARRPGDAAYLNRHHCQRDRYCEATRPICELTRMSLCCWLIFQQTCLLRLQVGSDDSHCSNCQCYLQEQKSSQQAQHTSRPDGHDTGTECLERSEIMKICDGKTNPGALAATADLGAPETTADLNFSSR